MEIITSTSEFELNTETAIAIGKVTITAIACALILGIVTNILLSKKVKDEE